MRVPVELSPPGDAAKCSWLWHVGGKAGGGDLDLSGEENEREVKVIGGGHLFEERVDFDPRDFRRRRPTTRRFLPHPHPPMVPPRSLVVEKTMSS